MEQAKREGSWVTRPERGGRGKEEKVSERRERRERRKKKEKEGTDVFSEPLGRNLSKVLTI